MNMIQAIKRARDVIRRQHKALSTEETYIFWLRRYISALRRIPLGLSSEKKLERFLTDLARCHDVSASRPPRSDRSAMRLPFLRTLKNSGLEGPEVRDERTMKRDLRAWRDLALQTASRFVAVEKKHESHFQALYLT